jgi:hypothetical protein
MSSSTSLSANSRNVQRLSRWRFDHMRFFLAVEQGLNRRRQNE